MQFALSFEPLPLNIEPWDLSQETVEILHETFYIRNLELLRDATRGSEQWVDLMAWLDEPIVDDNRPLSFATCCKVIGIEDPEENRETIKRYLSV